VLTGICTSGIVNQRPRKTGKEKRSSEERNRNQQRRVKARPKYKQKRRERIKRRKEKNPSEIQQRMEKISVLPHDTNPSKNSSTGGSHKEGGRYVHFLQLRAHSHTLLVGLTGFALFSLRQIAKGTD